MFHHNLVGILSQPFVPDYNVLRLDARPGDMRLATAVTGPDSNMLKEHRPYPTHLL